MAHMDHSEQQHNLWQIGDDLSEKSDDITSIVSYELRAPLTSIRAALGLLLTGMMGTLSPKGQRMLEIALSNTDRLMKVVEMLEDDSELSHDANPVAVPLDVEVDELKPLPHAQTGHKRIYYDRLTGLPNRTLFMSSLRQAIARTQHAPKHSFAVLIVALDRFQVVSDSLGRMAGEQLLVAIAQQLATYVESFGVLTRLQDSEFAILIHQVQTVDEIFAIASEIQRRLSCPFRLYQQEIFLTASLGITWGQQGYEHPEDVLHDAATALHRAQARGGNCYEMFDAQVRREAISRFQIETDLRMALERHEFQLHYQPVMSLTSDQVVGFEALLRWFHPEEGLVSPAKFVPIAEEAGLIHPIGLWVLRQACEQLRRWQQEFPLEPPLTMNVNLSAQQLSQPNLIEEVATILRETAIAPNTLKLEITETSIMSSPETAIATLKQLQACGIQLCVDDFGTGYSSLSYLHRFPLDTLKIDRSFVNRIDSEVEQLEIVQAIVKLAWNLGMNVVVEGVETLKQYAQLKALRCDYAQGYFFSKPVSAEAAVSFLQQKLAMAHAHQPH
ncbi:EAL domain-containing protein [Oscillatoria sp. FACHB-1407]|uniref:EAL domain-containing protein n=1 Tax=Oscillatoria sp. FACHB-1407 TaxID=2692847 RepID=UPI001686C528|nr:EAL domain-containing protein [Oscillatoria sp. FACHB-1407]MBD2465118.1 EAL domain-containing protein [Oscillatoria sp. FACHB-1407]